MPSGCSSSPGAAAAVVVILVVRRDGLVIASGIAPVNAYVAGHGCDGLIQPVHRAVCVATLAILDHWLTVAPLALEEVTCGKEEKGARVHL